MAERKARWAMWSVGSIANRVSVEISKSDKLDVVAVCSSSIEKAQSFIDKHGYKDAKPYTDIEEVLGRDDIDIVYISSPPSMHKEQCLKALNAKKAVLCEKPLTLNYQDAKEIFDCAKKNNVLMAEGIWSNFFPAMKKTMQWIKEGRIGEVREVISTFGFTLDDLRDPNDMTRWGNKLSSGGGALAQFGCYNVNFAQFVYGKAPENITGKCERIGREDGFDQSDAFIMTYDGGSRHAMLSCSFSAKTMTESHIAGEKGNIIIGKPFFAPYEARLLTHKDHLWYNDVDEEFIDPYGEQHKEGFIYQFEAISDYVVKGLTEAAEVSPEYSLCLAQTMDNVRKALGML